MKTTNIFVHRTTFKAVKPKYYKTEFGTIFGRMYMYTLMKSSFHGLSDDVFLIMHNIVVRELLVISDFKY